MYQLVDAIKGIHVVRVAYTSIHQQELQAVEKFNMAINSS